ncbi:APC family permease [Nocardioides terrisoli]|uniref:APC family permease n=1 Tax=Nocardioides terrisoli TaxID=3388267 RepID=UPI00287BA98F|nr:APC family permease [Nocardioides marmorisolisilvae]
MSRTMVEESARKLHGSLGVPAIVFMVVAAAAPLTVIAGVVPIGFAFGNGAGFPAMFALVGVLLLLFSVGFTTMTRHVPKPGAFFTYIAHGLGRPAGLAAAYAAILCYMAIEVGVLGYIGYEFNDGVNHYLHANIHWSVYTAVALIAVGWLGARHVELSARVLAVLLSLELTIVLLISLVALGKGGAHGLNLTSFTPSTVTAGAPSLALMFAAASFIGFEATAIFRDEAVNPHRTVPRATYAAVVVVGLFYTFASWAFVMAWGSGDVVKRAATDPNFLFSTARAELGGVGEFVTHLLVITSIFAAVLAFHTITTRYLHALSLAGALPSYLSGVHRRDGAPSSASITTTVASGILVVICLIAGMDPYLKMFTWFVGLGSMVYIMLLAVCTVAVLVYFARAGLSGESWWAVRLAPVLALIGLAWSAWITAKNFPLLVGDVNSAGNPVFGKVSIFLLALIGVAVVGGLVQAFILRARNAAAYDEIADADIAAA